MLGTRRWQGGTGTEAKGWEGESVSERSVNRVKSRLTTEGICIHDVNRPTATRIRIRHDNEREIQPSIEPSRRQWRIKSFLSRQIEI
jgi:hypothetical protein